MSSEKVIKILAEYKDMNVDEINPSMSFEELEFDSLDMVELVISFEDEFNISIEMSESIKKVSDLIGYIETKLKETE